MLGARPHARLAAENRTRPAAVSRAGPIVPAACAAGTAARASTRLNAIRTQTTAVTETSSSR